MNSTEVIRAFREEKPVRFGDIVFPFLDAVTYRRTVWTQFIEDNTPVGDVYDIRNLKIIQAEAHDQTGSIYTLNPLRLTPADPSEVNVPVTADVILADRLQLLDVFDAWCDKKGIAPDTTGLITFLYAEDLINAAKAYQVVRSFEGENNDAIRHKE